MSYVKSVLHQIEVAVETTIRMTETLNEEDLSLRPNSSKRSMGELLEHMATICEADYLILNEATDEEMAVYYSKNIFKTLPAIQGGFHHSFTMLKGNFEGLCTEELEMKTTSYWGLTYTKYEWLLEIMAHLYHHRGQLHAMLVYCKGNDPGISLFE